MKKLAFIIVAAVAMTLAACGGGNLDAVGTAQKFFDTFYGGDVMKAMPMIAPDERPTPTAESSAWMNEHYKSLNYTGVVVSEKSKIGKTEATVAFSVTSAADPEYPILTYIKLELIDGLWFVSDYDMYNL
jgi:hypothetical protein